jgi:hypothetical protein
MVRIEKVWDLTLGTLSYFANTTQQIHWVPRNDDWGSKSTALIIYGTGFRNSNSAITINYAQFNNYDQSSQTKSLYTANTEHFIGQQQEVIQDLTYPNGYAINQNFWLIHNPPLASNTYVTMRFNAATNTAVGAVLLSGVDPDLTANDISIVTNKVLMTANGDFTTYINATNTNNILLGFCTSSALTPQHTYGAGGDTRNQFDRYDSTYMDFAAGFEYGYGNTAMTWNTSHAGTANDEFAMTCFEIPAANPDPDTGVRIYQKLDANLGTSDTFTPYAEGDTYFIYSVAGLQNAGQRECTGVTYGGQAMTKLIDNIGLTDAYYTHTSFWGIKNPAIGVSASIVQTWDNTCDQYVAAGWLLKGVDVDNPVSAQTAVTTNNQILHSIEIESDDERGLVLSSCTIDDLGTQLYIPLGNAAYTCKPYNSSTGDYTWGQTSGRTSNTTHTYSSQSDIRDALLIGLQVNPTSTTKCPWNLIANRPTFVNDSGTASDWQFWVPTYNSDKDVILIVAVYGEESSGSEIRTKNARWNNKRMNLMHGIGDVMPSSTEHPVAVYYMVNPDPGNNTFYVDWVNDLGSVSMNYATMSAMLIDDISDKPDVVLGRINQAHIGNNFVDSINANNKILSVPTTGITNDDILVIGFSGEGIGSGGGDYAVHPTDVRVGNSTGESFTIASGNSTQEGFTSIAYITGDKVDADPLDIYFTHNHANNTNYVRTCIVSWNLENGALANLDVQASSNASAPTGGTGLDATLNITPEGSLFAVYSTGQEQVHNWSGVQNSRQIGYTGTSGEYTAAEGADSNFSSPNQIKSHTVGVTHTNSNQGTSLTVVSFNPQGESSFAGVGNTSSNTAYGTDVRTEITNQIRESIQLTTMSCSGQQVWGDLVEPAANSSNPKTCTFHQLHTGSSMHGESILHFSNDKGPVMYDVDWPSTQVGGMAITELFINGIDPLPFLTKIKII